MRRGGQSCAPRSNAWRAKAASIPGPRPERPYSLSALDLAAVEQRVPELEQSLELIVEQVGIFAKVSHFLFPANSRYFGARVGDNPSHILRFRVPVDDEKTMTFFVRGREARGMPGTITNEGLKSRGRGVYDRVEDEWWGLHSRDQDRAAQESQGVIAPRTGETLATSDTGVAIFRKMLDDAIRAAARATSSSPSMRRSCGPAR
jgi:hypothetical protein